MGEYGHCKRYEFELRECEREAAGQWNEITSITGCALRTGESGTEMSLGEECKVMT